MVCECTYFLFSVGSCSNSVPHYIYVYGDTCAFVGSISIVLPYEFFVLFDFFALLQAPEGKEYCYSINPQTVRHQCQEIPATLLTGKYQFEERKFFKQNEISANFAFVVFYSDFSTF